MNVTPQILKSGGHEDRGEVARLQYFVGAIAVGDMLKSTLGPKGRDKILQPMGGEGSSRQATTITNDGATIVKSVWLDNPAAKILVDLSKQQDEECGDGTTGVVVLAAELLRQAEQLVCEQKIHPQIIIQGYRLALATARAKLDSLVVDRSADPAAFRAQLVSVARTTLSSKMLTWEKAHFAELAVDAVLRLAEAARAPAAGAVAGSAGPSSAVIPAPHSPINLELIQIIKKPGGTLGQSFLSDGFLLEKRVAAGQPRVLDDCKVLVCNTPMDTDKIKIYGARVKVDSFAALGELEKAEREKMREKVDKIAAFGCNVFVNRQLIYNYPEQLFKERGIIAIEHADFDGVEKLAAVLGGEICSTFDDPNEAAFGRCARLEEVEIGESRLLKFSGCSRAGASSVVLRGANDHVLAEAERSLHDALAVLSVLVNDPRTVPGAGAAELAMAEAVDCVARETPGKKALALEAFARALRQMPTILLDNGGFDAAQVVGELRAAHHRGEHAMGVDIERGRPGDAWELGVVESFRARAAQLTAAAEAAEMIIRVDDIIKCAPRERRGM